MHQMQVDVEERRLACGCGDQVGIPDFIEQSASGHFQSSFFRERFSRDSRFTTAWRIGWLSGSALDDFSSSIVYSNELPLITIQALPSSTSGLASKLRL